MRSRPKKKKNLNLNKEIQLVINDVEISEVKHNSHESCLREGITNVLAQRNSESHIEFVSSRKLVKSIFDLKAPSQPLETKRDKFVRLCEARVNKAVDKILNLQHLSNQNNYQYDENYVATMIELLENEITTLKTKFSNRKTNGM
jgi:hypothetical protein